MKKNKYNTKNQKDLFNIQDRLHTAVCVPAIRAAVKAWKAGGYKGITETTRELINFWFYTDHVLPNGNTFKFHNAQRESIETLIYIFEVEKIRSRKELLEKYVTSLSDLRLPPYDDFARYCVKMATGSGKTMVMSMCIVWQFANFLRGEEGYANNFLVLAPNVIVFERLTSDFANGFSFRTLPLVPKHLLWLWDMNYYMRGDAEKSHSIGALYLTNIQQFYPRKEPNRDAENEIMTNLLGSLPPANKLEISDFDERIAKRDGLLMVLNDEAHHTHDEDSEWNRFIRRLHRQRPLTAQVDFSATPRYSKGSLFSWTIFDYPLKQAIVDGIVKRPIKGISKVKEKTSNDPVVRYGAFLTAGVERWKEYNKQLSALKKKPILFIMMNNTDEADKIDDWLKVKYPAEFGGEKSLVIHTDTKGDVSKKDLDKARKLAKEVDREQSPVNAITSVLMLREGWDVKNVTVVVGLRPYTAKANILPEQTIGRGLRLMFRNYADGFKERVDIIGNRAFMDFVDDLEKLEDLKFESFEIGKDKLKILIVQPLPEKAEYDIGIPVMTPLIGRKKSLAEEIASIDVMAFNINPLPFKDKDHEQETFVYEGRDILTDEVLLEREYTVPPVQTAEEVIGYYARRISNNIKLPSQFASLAPKIREFFELKAFGKKVDLTEPAIIKAISSNVASYVVTKEFEKVLRNLIIEEKTAELVSENKFLSSTPPFPTSKNKIINAKRTVFNLTPCDNDFEYKFAKFLDKAEDVKAFAKLPEQFGFCIQYTDTRANIRNYYPDFIVLTPDGNNLIIETKGREDIEVRLKDNAAVNWCNKATELTGKDWKYLKVPQKEFEGLNPENIEELMAGILLTSLFD